ncbi:MAG: U32 family peptidase [Prevotellaceae bacterium]|jgi:putative protease|nr:U32 family peptidase [Prevotellaceae bacterium]
MTNHRNLSKPELLAPAKNCDMAIAAINHGADAVYMAAEKFGAREAAGNSLHDVAKAVAYAHRFRAKLYLTLNTILYEHELDEARQLAVAAYEMGCDALIVQDMAFLEMDLPPIALHASTQAHNAFPEKVKFLQDVGFSRVVLARELSLSQIANICAAAPGVELEAFVHGALCVSYSGQCYLSQYLTGRSANRGACAQPCRSTYKLMDGNGRIIVKNKHLLSLRDLNLTEHLSDLRQVGVYSFKIEGRLKDASYVKNVVAHYRKTIDKIFLGQKKTSSGQTYLNFDPQPDKTFSRGFTTYFIDDKPQNMSSINTPKSLGEEIGAIWQVHNEYINVKLKVEVHAGDGICFFSKSDILHGTNVNRVDGSCLFLQDMTGVAVGAAVFRNFDVAFQRQLASCSARRLVDAKISLTATPTNICITATDEDNISASLLIEKKNIIATNEAKTLSSIKEQLEKSGGSMFNVTHVNVNMEETYFYAISELNSWRRSVLEQLEQKRQSAYIVKRRSIVKNIIPYPNLKLNFSGNVLNSYAKNFYDRHGVAEISPAFEQKQPQSIVPLMTTRYCLLRELGFCKKNSLDKILQKPLFLENNGYKLRLKFSCKDCKMTVEKEK